MTTEIVAVAVAVAAAIKCLMFDFAERETRNAERETTE
jgi:hypothetical protein